MKPIRRVSKSVTNLAEPSEVKLLSLNKIESTSSKKNRSCKIAEEGSDSLSSEEDFNDFVDELPGSPTKKTVSQSSSLLKRRHTIVQNQSVK